VEETLANSGGLSVGFLEAEGFIAIFDGIEVMTKTSHVHIGGIMKLGGGLVAVSVIGELAHVIEAIEAGADTIRAGHGVPARSIVFANPSPIIGALAVGLEAIG
jgi:ethanolamine utilization protein EutM